MKQIHQRILYRLLFKYFSLVTFGLYLKKINLLLQEITQSIIYNSLFRLHAHKVFKISKYEV